MKITNGAIHVHSRDSIFDAISSKETLIDRIVELGGTALCITDHGTLTGVLDCLDYAQKEKIKLVYGVEAYVDLDLGGVIQRTHLLLMAKNEEGMYAINDAVTASNKNLQKNFPCMTLDILKENFGKGTRGYNNVIATSACIQGPLGTIISSNDILINKISKEEKALNKLNFKEDDKILYEEQVNALSVIEEKITIIEKSIIPVLKSKRGKKPIQDRMAIEYLTECLKQLKSNKSELSSKIKQTTDTYNNYISISNSIKTITDNLKTEDVLYNEAKDYAVSLRELFGENNFYLEIQYHFLSKELEIMPKLVAMSKELNIPCVATNDAHMACFSKENIDARKVAKFLRYGTIFDDETDNNQSFLVDKNGIERNPENELYIKCDDELFFALSHIAPDDVVLEAMNNVKNILDMCYSFTIPDKKYYPVYKKGIDSKVELRRLAYEGIEMRFPCKIGWNEIYQQRLEHELKIICSMGYADYHLIVREYLAFGKILGQTPEEEWDNVPMTSIEDAEAWFKDKCKVDKRFGLGIGIGEGRGSAAGSLVCFLLGITGIDPIKYNLLFERFLNPERISMPDIDSDFAPTVRGKVIEYVINKYGEAAVCCIVTKSIADVKGSCNASARYLDALNNNVDKKTYVSVSDKISKSIDNDNALFKNLEECKSRNDKYDILTKYFEENELAIKIISIARNVDGIVTALGQHAAGVIISGNGDVSKCIPLRYNSITKAWTSQCDKEQAEASGLLKMDFLGLKNLGIITTAIRLIYKNHGVRVDIREVPYTNESLIKEVMHYIYALGNTVGVFQFESPGMKNLLQNSSNFGANPITISDLIMNNAMYRPGPMEYIPVMCDIKNGRKEVHYDTPQMESILSETYGIMVYQEQVMQVCQTLAGYSLADADNVRRIMSKKKEAALLKERKTFVYGDENRNIKGCVNNNIPEDVANKVFDDMIDFAKYAFNKSHAAIYAITSFYTAWLKYCYPHEFYTALLIYCEKIEEITKFIVDAKNYNINNKKIEIVAPDINKSEVLFSTDGQVVRFGLKSIKGFSSVLAEKIVAERNANGPFSSVHDFVKRIKCSASVLELLTQVGAFDSLIPSRQSLLIKIPYLVAYSETLFKKALFVSEGQQIISLIEKGSAVYLKDIESYGFKEFKISSSSGLLPSVDKLRDRVSNGIVAYNNALQELSIITIDPILTDKMYLEEEKSLLGCYLTSHPIRLFDVKTPNIIYLNDGDEEISGIVTNLRIKNGHCLFSLEDTSGSIDCVIWSSDYKKLDIDIKEGSALYMSSKIVTNTYNNTERLQVVFNKKDKISLLEKRKASLLLTVKDVVELLDMTSIINEYADENNGHTLVIYDTLFSEYRTYSKKVHSSILNSKLPIKNYK